MKTLLLISSAILIGIWLKPLTPHLFVSPPVKTITEAYTPTPTPTPKVDDLVDTYSKKYGKTPYKANRTKALLHFLLLREQNYGGSNNCGDSGKACGPLQFHAGTYQGYRKIMMDKGLVSDMGSRLDMEDAIETTAWAINDGRESAWGPVARGEIKL
ncbi:MAG: hypothetical protein CV087_17450 [Candidatus Brocadia sp. WS118]|nr:MAG: hypothetical protein CV087_17450 [Candidatus Brocadia sp. WS118]